MNFKGNKKIWLGLGVLALCILILIIVKLNSKQEKTVLQPPLVKTLKISSSNKDSQYVYAGQVHSRYESQLAFQVGGKIVKRNVEVGDKVEQGRVLMELDSRDIEQVINNYAAQVSSAQSKYNLAEDNLKRVEQLYLAGAVSKAAYDDAVNSDNVAKAALDQVNALYAQYSIQLGYCKLRADKSGIIGSIAAEEGQVATAGLKMVTLVQNNELEIEINVPENRLEQLKNAHEINVGFWALPDVKVKGVLRVVSPVANDASRTYTVRISLINPPPSIQIGMTSNVSVSQNTSSGKIWIPVAAVYQQASSPQVWIVKESKVSLENITITDFSGDQVAVTAGLGEGDVVVTAGVNNLREGQAVRIGGDN
ncbi:MAG TPA: efflux RND transporter periplasmic adaptor subunit [Syntrophomonadaceae bacterium]|nr:efflux RND transporter periplasmic adaptor subunit [Syntrophomonadaceae bacterium]